MPETALAGEADAPRFEADLRVPCPGCGRSTFRKRHVSTGGREGPGAGTGRIVLRAGRLGSRRISRRSTCARRDGSSAGFVAASARIGRRGTE